MSQVVNQQSWHTSSWESDTTWSTTICFCPTTSSVLPNARSMGKYSCPTASSSSLSYTTIGLPPTSNPTSFLTLTSSFTSNSPCPISIQRSKDHVTSSFFRQMKRHGNIYSFLHSIYQRLPLWIWHGTEQGHVDLVSHANWFGSSMARIHYGSNI